MRALLGRNIPTATRYELQGHRINKWPKRLNKIVRKRESIASIGVMNTNGRMQPRSDDGTGKQRTQNGVTVVQQTVNASGFTITSEVITQEQRLIPPCQCHDEAGGLG